MEWARKKNGFTVICFFVFFITGITLMGSVGANENATELEGEWSGNDSQNSIWTFTFKGNSMKGIGPNNESFNGSYVLNTGAAPKTIDISVGLSSDNGLVNKTLLGIYTIDVRSLRLCLDMGSDGGRPSSFLKDANNDNWTLTRISVDKESEDKEGDQHFAVEVLIATVSQMLILFGPLLVVGLLIAYFEKLSNKMLMSIFSFKAVIYSTGWLGTPIHETGHALFCLIFRHKVHEFVPFKPEKDESGGYVLGYVKHSDNGTIYNKIGYLFIGAGPIILGSTIIALLIRFLLPAGDGFFFDLDSVASSAELTIGGYLDMFVETVKLTIRTIFWDNGWSTFSTWQFWVFFVAASCISLHMSLSPPDLKSAWTGAGIIALILLVLNIVFVFIGQEGWTSGISAYLMFAAGILFVGLILSIVTMILIFLFTATIGKLKGR